MSVVLVRAALEVALGAMSPALATAFENAPFLPVAGTPYQKLNVVFDSPDNDVFGRTHREVGTMNLVLKYPLQLGTAAVAARAELIRSTFYRGQSFSSGGVTVIIEKTPEIAPGIVDGDRFAVPVKVRFYANIF